MKSSETIVIAISGVPGTGKTATAKLLAKKLGANLISITELVKQKKVKSSYDKKRKIRAVDMSSLQKAVKKDHRPGLNIIDGHMSHLLAADMVFVLRCNPEVLQKRLEKREYHKEKVRENVDAELTDVITAEAMAENKAVFEIDTTKSSPQKTASLLHSLIRNPKLRAKYKPGKVNWLERYAKESTS